VRPIGSIHSDIRYLPRKKIFKTLSLTYSDKNKRMFKGLLPVFLQLNSIFKDRPFMVGHSVGLP
jgi:hypothetical protein